MAVDCKIGNQYDTFKAARECEKSLETGGTNKFHVEKEWRWTMAIPFTKDVYVVAAGKGAICPTLKFPFGTKSESDAKYCAAEMSSYTKITHQIRETKVRGSRVTGFVSVPRGYVVEPTNQPQVPESGKPTKK